MMEQTGKKIWCQPKMFVLVRTRPEEAVLEHCKVSDQAIGAGPNTLITVQGCSEGKDTADSCTNCHSRGKGGT